MLQTRMPNPNDVYTLRSSRADRYPVPMDVMDDSDVRRASNNRSQSVADKLSDKNDEMLVHFGATSMVDSVSTRNAAISLVQGRGRSACLACNARLSEVVWWSRQLFRSFSFFGNWHTAAYGSRKFIPRVESGRGHRLGAGRRIGSVMFRSKFYLYHFDFVDRTISTGVPRYYWRNASETVD
jgi:hypothetical protein